MRCVSVVSLMAAAVLLAACGDAPAPSSADKPQVGKLERSSESAKGSGAPTFEKLVERQSSTPRSRFTPCSLVTRAQAAAILGAPVLVPREAPQGPTCIYRSRSGDDFITLAVEQLSFAGLKRQQRGERPVEVGERSAFCGANGQPMLYVQLARERVLSVAAPCPVAKRFATRAVARL